MKVWKNITIELPGYDLTNIFEKLGNLDIISITIKDKRNEIESDWYEDPRNPGKLNGDTHNIVLLVDVDTEVSEIISEIKFELNIDYFPAYKEETFKDKNWVRYSQSQFSTIKINDILRITPPWKKDTSFQGRSIVIQPGSGFGTGEHPTTYMCLKWLCKNIKGGESVLDYGCGSGILSITAKKLGADVVKGIDIDNRAINNANHNNKLNQTNVPFLISDDYVPKKKYQIIIANILLSTLIKLEPKLSIAGNSKIILSGVLEKQVPEISAIFDHWVKLKIEDEMNGWVLLEGLIK